MGRPRIPGGIFEVLQTEAGEPMAPRKYTKSEYDGYAEWSELGSILISSIKDLMEYFFEIIDPYSVNKQGQDVGPKYRTGVYSLSEDHLLPRWSTLMEEDASKGAVEVLPVSNFTRGDDEHQDRFNYIRTKSAISQRNSSQIPH